MDEMILKTQEWLNKTYKGRHGYIEIDLDDDSIKGKTGWTTIYALTRAFQIELGIPEPASNFGPSTSAKFKEKYPSGISPAGPNETDEVYCIIQGALWCKGYTTGHYAGALGSLDTHFDDSVADAIRKLKSDAGLFNPNGVITLNVMKALLSMDYFVIGKGTGGDNGIRIIQQELNREYEDYIGLMPCDGIYGRNTNKALIYALQAEEGLAIGVANGNFGPTMQSKCPTLPGSGLTIDQEYRFTRILQHSLYCNGFSKFGASGNYDAETRQDVEKFQAHYALTVTGICDLGTWMSLLTSRGDPSRPAKACDCATILTPAKATTLKNAGYEVVGRYLTGTIGAGISKALTDAEIDIIFEAGLRFFPIYQTSARSESYFTSKQGNKDAMTAVQAAYNLQIPENTILYFAVDFDAMDYQITNSIIPYFKSVYNTVSTSEIRKYRVGIYGARNICTRVCKQGYAMSSFVGDMSTGFSGNLGFTIPDNWAFDQFDTVKIGSGDGQIEIDKDGYSGRDKGVSTKQASPPFHYEYGAVENPETGEIYPIQFYKNFETVTEPAYEEEINEGENKPTRLGKASFDLAKFIAGLAFDDSLIESNHPVVGGIAGILIGGITSFNESWDALYLDVHYYKAPTGQKKAMVCCGESSYCKLFDEWEYGYPKSLKSIHSSVSSSPIPGWEDAVDDMAKAQYAKFKGITPNDDYQYDLWYTFNEKRKGDQYVSYIFLGDDGNMYEYAKIHPGEKIEIVVTKGWLYEEVDRLDILPFLSPISKLPEDKVQLFTILAQ